MLNLRLLCWAAAEWLTHLRTLMDGQTDRHRQTILKVSLESTAAFVLHSSAELLIHVSPLLSKVQLRDNIVLNLQHWLL